MFPLTSNELFTLTDFLNIALYDMSGNLTKHYIILKLKFFINKK